MSCGLRILGRHIEIVSSLDSSACHIKRWVEGWMTCVKNIGMGIQGSLLLFSTQVGRGCVDALFTWSALCLGGERPELKNDNTQLGVSQRLDSRKEQKRINDCWAVVGASAALRMSTGQHRD